MNVFQRLFTTMRGNFEYAVSQIENHEALADCAIQEMHAAYARARVQLSKVQQDGQRMREKLESLRREAQLWEERALRVRESDEKRALECIRRKKHQHAEANALAEQLKSHEELEAQLAQDLSTISQHIEQVKRKRNTLRTRQSRAQAVGAVESCDSAISGDIDAIFERWEVKVTECETLSTLMKPSADGLERDFRKQEEDVDLKAELEALVNKH